MSVAIPAGPIPYEVNEWLEDLERAIDEGPAIFDRIAEAAMASLWWIPWPFRDDAERAMRWLIEEAADLMVNLLQQIVELIQGAWFPLLAWGHIGKWGAIKDVMTEIEASLSDLPLDRVTEWTGDGATLYDSIVVPGQSQAVSAMKDAAATAEDEVRNLVFAVIAFYLALAAALVTWLVEQAASVPAAAAYGAGVATSAASTLKTIGIVIGILALVAAYVDRVTGAINTLDEQLTGAPFAGDQWPEAVE